MTVRELIDLLQGMPLDRSVFLLTFSERAQGCIEREPWPVLLPEHAHLCRDLAASRDKEERVVIQ